MRSAVASACGLLLTMAAGGRAADEAYRGEIQKWRDAREARLKADGGWLSVAGLTWLKPGENTFGTGPGVDVVLPKGSAPPLAGTFVLKGGQTRVELAAGVQARVAGSPVTKPTPLKPDSDERVEMGDVTLQVIERGGRYAIRLRDKNAAARREFTGCRWYEIKESYRIEAKWVPYPSPRRLKVPNVLGETESMVSPGYAEFELGGKRVQVVGALEEPGSTELWFILRDQTSGKETYPAGRFLYADLPRAGKVVLDFNKSYNPPCAFTAFATCPLPPPSNWMPVRVEAGELNYGKH
ncbi:MAG: DUF1684 domain-containing protein [Burkholderiales bacterium]